jgi:hypothetical protein
MAEVLIGNMIVILLKIGEIFENLSSMKYIGGHFLEMKVSLTMNILAWVEQPTLRKDLECLNDFRKLVAWASQPLN